MRHIGLLDCNNFFVSCERLFRPDLRGKPVAVLSSNDGCIVARSSEVKELGIPMGAPVFQVLDTCTKAGVVLFSSNFELYRDISRKVMQALKDEGFRMQVYSIDEAFFYSEECLTEAMLTHMRSRIMQKTGIPVSIGISNTKTRAKIANHVAKKRAEGVCILTESEWYSLQKELSCSSVWGIGREISALLTRNDIKTVEDFLSIGKSRARELLGIHGERLFEELRGVSVYESDEDGDIQKSFMSTRSFSTVTHDKAFLKSALTHHASELGRKLREEGLVTSELGIMIRGSRYGDFSHRDGTRRVSLGEATNSDFVLVQASLCLLDTLFDPEIPYKRAGVYLGGILPEDAKTDSLFHEVSRKKCEDISHELDLLNKKFGKDTVHLGSLIQGGGWESKSEKRSPRYTTRWGEIPTVKAI